MNNAHVTTLEDLDGGLTAEICYDRDVDMPYADDEAVHIVVLHGKYIDPSKGTLGADPKAVQKWCDTNEAEWYTVPLWMYDHSGTVYRVAAENPFHCRWDSGRVGIVALKRSEWGNGAETDEELFKRAQGIASEYSDWANGECFGYILKDEDGDEVDACWGFIGRDAVEAEAKAAAGSRAIPSSPSP